MNIKSTINKILSNSLLLRVIFVLSLFNLIGYIVYGNIHAIIFFLLVAGLVKFFSKNMILILGIPLFVVNLFVLGKSHREGMVNKSKSNSDSDSTNDSTNDSSDNDSSSTKDTSNNMKKMAIMNKAKSDKTSDSSNNSNDDDSKNNSSNKKIPTSNEESFEVGRKKSSKYNIDYASTIENAYDDLNNIIGSDGIKNLTNDTQNLMQQQLKLAETMQGMGPLIEQMGPLMQSFGPMMDQAKSFMGGSSAKNFTAGK
jgi:hypothetical protein